MIKRFVTSAALAVALAACGGSGGGEKDDADTDAEESASSDTDAEDSADADGDGEVSMEEAAKSMETIRPDPGKYEVTTRLVNLEIPDAPPEAREMMKAVFGGNEARVTESCLTEEEAEKGFEEMAKKDQDGDCAFDKFEMSGGKFDAVMNCTGTDGSTAKIVLDGKGTKTTSDMTMNMEGKGPGGETMKMTFNVKQKRIGDCDG